MFVLLWLVLAVLGFIIGIITGGYWQQLVKKITWWPLLIIMLLLWLMYLLVVAYMPQISPWQGVVFTLLGLVFLWKNRCQPGAVIALLGVAMNMIFLIVSLSGFFVPFGTISWAANWQLVSAGNFGLYFARWLFVPWPFVIYFSFGDALIGLGIFWYIIRTMRNTKNGTKITSIHGLY